MSCVLFEKMIGGSISTFHRVCDLITIQIITKENEIINLHIQTFFRIIKDKKVIVSSEDMYRSKTEIDSEGFELDTMGNSVYDESIERYLSIIQDSIIFEAYQEKNGDLIIALDNDLVFEVLINTSISEEKYRIFNDDDELDLIVMS